MCKLYEEAGHILHASFTKKKGSLKTLLHVSQFTGNKRKLAAVVKQTNRHLWLLAPVVCRHLHPVGGGTRDRRFWLLTVVLYEYLSVAAAGVSWGCQRLLEEREVRRAADERRLDQVKADWLLLSSDWQRRLPLPPVYLRANLCSGHTIPQLEQMLVSQGYELISLEEPIQNCERSCAYMMLCQVKQLKPLQCIRDPYITGLYIFSGQSPVKQTKLFHSSLFYSQDRASATVGQLLSPLGADATVLDTCAAPGGKTLHAASIMWDCHERRQRLRSSETVGDRDSSSSSSSSSRIIALELDVRRFNTLNRLVKESGADGLVTTFNMDVFHLNPAHEMYRHVTHAIVDPSCSGSGMPDRINDQCAVPPSRRAKLRGRFSPAAAAQSATGAVTSVPRVGLQAKMLKKALQLPAVQHVVYSTCSVHQEENEYVVADALATFASQFAVAHIPAHFSSSRGAPGFPFSQHVLRFWPAKDLTCGFFICHLQRIHSN